MQCKFISIVYIYNILFCIIYTRFVESTFTKSKYGLINYSVVVLFSSHQTYLTSLLFITVYSSYDHVHKSQNKVSQTRRLIAKSLKL